MVDLAKMYQEYIEVYPKFKYLVETRQRQYLANAVDLKAKNLNKDVYFELALTDVWALDEKRPSRFLPSCKILTFSDVNIEEIKV
ncbi:MAG: DUF2469 family protein [Bifidobacteriaceae bacterium]|jgi:hypothetical protein|nr:DUF2469 family protein [Bifidobacteriaceae bacterium]